MSDRGWSTLAQDTPTDTDRVALQRGGTNLAWAFLDLVTYLKTKLFLQSNVTSIIETGYQFTPIVDAGVTVTPDFTAGYAVRAIAAGLTTIDLSTLATQEVQGCVYIEAATGPVTFTGGTPIEDGSDPGSGVRRCYLERVGTTIYANWTPSG